MRFALVPLLLLAATTAAWADQADELDESIVVMKDEKEASKARKFFDGILAKARNGARGSNIEGSVDLVSLANLKFGVIAGVAEMSDDDFAHDVDKLYGDVLRPNGGELHKWSRITLGGQLVLPLYFSFTNILGPLGLNVGGEIALKQTISLTTPTKHGLLEPVGGVFPEAWRRVTRTWNALGTIRIPRNPRQLLEKYVPGTEIKIEGTQGVVAKVGVNVGLPVLTGNVDVSAFVLGQFERRIRLPYADGRKLVRVSFRNLKRAGAGHEESIKLGVTLFQTSLINGVLNVNLLSSKRVLARETTLLYDFTYDLDHPEADRALRAALKGDLRPSQELGIFRDGEDHYRGVTVNDQSTQVLTSMLKQHALGFSIDNSLIRSLLGETAYREAFGGFLFFGRARTTSQSQTDSDGYFHERQRLQTFDFSADHSDRALWGLVSNEDRKAIVSAQLVLAEGVLPSGEVGSQQMPKLVADYVRVNRHNGNKVIDPFLRESLSVLGVTDDEGGMGAVIEGAITSRRCASKKKATYELKTTIQGESVRNIARHKEEYAWFIFGRLIDAPVPFWLTTEYFRESTIQQLDKAQLKKARKFERDFIPNYRRIRAAATDAKRLEAMRDLLKAYDTDTMGIEALLLLTQPERDDVTAGPATGLTGLDGFYAQFSLDAEKCKYTWASDTALRVPMPPQPIDRLHFTPRLSWDGPLEGEIE